MIKNYFKIAWRNLKKNKVFSFINIFGLSVGFTCCMLIAAFLSDEFSYDNSPVHAKDIYRVELNIENKDFYSSIDNAVAEGIRQAFPEVLATTRLNTWGNIFVQCDKTQFKEKSIAIADSNFLSFFSVPFSKGDAATALTNPNSVVLSEEYATKYFGKEDPIGQTLFINNKMDQPFKVTGIIAKQPGNMHFYFDIYMSMSRVNSQPTWSNLGTYTYLQLKPGVDVAKLEAKFPQLVAKNVVPEIQHDMGVSLAEAQKSVNTFVFYLKPLRDIHLHSANKDELGINGSMRYVYIFTALALFILLLACVNFTNLSTAVSIKRSKEVGIRKVMGSAKKQLVSQFLAESVMLALFAFLFSLLFVYLLLPYFNQLSGKHLRFEFFLQYKIILIEIALAVLAGIFAGLYPAFFLSSFNIINILKGKTSGQPKGAFSLRSGLVVFQFAVSITMIISTVIVFQQLNYMQNKSLGFDKEQALVINDTYLLGKNQQVFKEQLSQDSRISNITLSHDVPVDAKNSDGTQAYLKPIAQSQRGPEIHIDKFHVDDAYINTLGMKIIDGRNFSKEYSTDSSAVVMNETAVAAFGIGKSNPIGQTIIMSGQQAYTVIGVVKDFHYQSVKEKIGPLVMMLGQNAGGLIVKVKPSNISGLLADIKKSWGSYNAEGPLSYSFMDEKFATVYSAEEKTGRIFTLFAAISIIIAALGLFGLSAFSTEQRTKEIGVRKVLGASIQNVVILLSKEFLYMVIIAFVIAVPITWFAMNKWLQEFAYRINISWVTILLSGVFAVTIAFFTVSFRAIKAAVANPVKSLRTE